MAVQTLLPLLMNAKDEDFFKALGARVAQARKDQGLTQQQLADQLGIPQQTMANYEVARARLPASMLAQLMTLSLDELIGRQPDEPAAMSLRCGCCQSRTRPRKWPGSVAGRLYVGRVTTSVVT